MSAMSHIWIGEATKLIESAVSALDDNGHRGGYVCQTLLKAHYFILRARDEEFRWRAWRWLMRGRS
jgi:hypothetical protein